MSGVVKKTMSNPFVSRSKSVCRRSTIARASDGLGGSALSKGRGALEMASAVRWLKAIPNCWW